MPLPPSRKTDENLENYTAQYFFRLISQVAVPYISMCRPLYCTTSFFHWFSLLSQVIIIILQFKQWLIRLISNNYRYHNMSIKTDCRTKKNRSIQFYEDINALSLIRLIVFWFSIELKKSTHNTLELDWNQCTWMVWSALIWYLEIKTLKTVNFRLLPMSFHSFIHSLSFVSVFISHFKLFLRPTFQKVQLNLHFHSLNFDFRNFSFNFFLCVFIFSLLPSPIDWKESRKTLLGRRA